ncbi:glycoside hydrolase family 26 protein [Streptomyces sp. NBC_00102]|uniref:glycoside hydrolase family 26 protein n=1 Tax=Streptomyces sp. NBC_00102 TaxID=2975652 RepID=UPI002259EF8F|nr:glycosyl hydrolase [Streptomyces sp. NBC_00102]MCX5401188.1 glycosyl hydrolase [Streptomyces sp. NBC_00102]
MSGVGRRGLLRWAAGAAVAATAGCAPSRTAPIGAGGEGAEERTAPYVPFDVTWLIRPRGDHKYLGVSFAGKPVTPGYLALWSRRTGKAPTLLAQSFTWDEEFPRDRVAAVWEQRVLPYLSWEPFGTTLREIAAGARDGYVRHVAEALRDLNVPVALAFAPGMNDGGRPWGAGRASPEEFVGAWRHVHDLFQDMGVSNVVWVWSPTVAVKPSVRLKPYYPGDAYADWLGVAGRYTERGPHTYDSLFGPAVEEARAFTRIPVLVAGTAAPPGDRRPADVADLVRAVTTRGDVVGFVWFDANDAPDGIDWRIDSGPGALAAFRRGVADPRFGFDVRRP